MADLSSLKALVAKINVKTVPNVKAWALEQVAITEAHEAELGLLRQEVDELRNSRPTRPPAPTTPGNVPTPPNPPARSNYTIPGGATTVSNVTDLATELAGGVAKDIKVAAGNYSRSGPIYVTTAHRIWCEDNVTFDFGFGWNYANGWEFHGGTFNIPTTAKAAADGGNYAALLNWFGADRTTNVKISDVTINGNGVLTHGINIGATGGTDIQRIRVDDTTQYGIRVSSNSGTTETITRITDLYITNVYNRANYRGYHDGTAEAALWVGHPVTNPVTRMYFRNIGWMGLWTGHKSANTTFSHMDIDSCWGTVPSVTPMQNGAAVYCERTNENNIFEYFWFGRDSGDIYVGFNCEWDTGSPGTATNNCTFRYGTINCSRDLGDTISPPRVGIRIDEGCDNNVAHHIRFENMDWACIDYYLNLNTTTANFYSNDYRNRASGAEKGTTAHWDDGTPVETFDGSTDIVIERAW